MPFKNALMWDVRFVCKSDSNMAIPHMICTSASWLYTTNPEYFTLFYTKIWILFNSCFIVFNTFVSGAVQRVTEKQVCLAGKYKVRVPETNNVEDYNW